MTKLSILLPALLIFFSMSCTSQTMETNKSFEKATFGTGCFWCTETIFEQLKGVQKASSGYTGGQKLNPTYEEICTGTTGHAEAIEITYDPSIITYKELLEVFWSVHNPTTLNRQGADVGTQYRSAIFYHSDKQKNEAEFYRTQLDESHAFPNPIVTEISPADKFYEAETYHQDYYIRNTKQPYCQMVIAPKIEKFKKAFSEKLK